MPWAESSGGFQTYEDPTASTRIAGDFNLLGAQRARDYDKDLRGRGLSDAQIGIQPAMLAQQLREQRFQTLWPFMQNQIGNFNSSFGQVGGASGKSPEITVGGVFNPQQIQQQVNSARSANDQQAQGQMQQQAQNVAGRGFGSNVAVPRSKGSILFWAQ